MGPLPAALVGACVCAGLAAQTFGGLEGQVLDSSHAAVPRAAVTVANSATGLRRQGSTSGNGYYSIAELPTGAYSVQVEHEGFQTAVQRNVKVGVAEPVRLDFTLVPGVRTETVEVRGESSSLQPDETSLGATVSGQFLASLPINGRDYARFSLLAPGTLARSNLVADLSFNGLHSVHNQFAIDGIDATRVDQPYLANGLERGARLLTGSLDSIAEFRIHTANYQAEYGRAASAYVNIATKSGTNEWHGGLYEYLRNNWLDARNFFNTKPSPQAPFLYNDWGGNLSGPMRKDSTFFFVNYEGSRQRIGVIGSGTVPSDSLRQQILETSPALAPILAMMPHGFAPTTDSRVDSYSTEQSLSVREDTASARLSQHWGSRNSAYARLNWNDSRVRGPLYSTSTQMAALGLLDQQDVPIRATNLAIGDEHVFSPFLVNQFLAGMQRIETRLITDAPQQPLVQVTGITVQPGSRGRSATANTSYQVGDMMSLAVGEHTLKWGATGRNARLVQKTSGVALLVYTSLDDFANNHASSVNLMAGNPGSATWVYEVGAFAQDTWRALPKLTVDYGIRYDYFAPPFDPQQRARPFDPGTGLLAPAGSDYFQSNRHNFAPRIGLAWQPSGRVVIRSGYGIFYEAYPVGLGVIPGNTLPGTTTILAQEFPSLGYPLQQLQGFGAAAKPLVTGFERHKPDLYSQQWNLTVQWQASRNDIIEAGYLGNRGLHLRRNLNINLVDPATGQRPNPNFTTIDLETATGNSDYHSLDLGWSRRFASRLSGEFHYFWSHAIDDVQDPAVSGSAQPQDNHNFRAERGNSSTDARHRMSYALLYTLPPGRSWLFRTWTLAGVGLYRTGIAETVTIGVNTSGTGNMINQRPDAVAGVSSYAVQKTADHWFNPPGFHLPAPGAFGNLGRNTVYGPGLAQTDLSMSKNTRLGEKWTLQFRAEVFNCFNKPNLAQPNSVFGTPAFGQIFSTLGNTIGMGTARQIQLTLRLSF
jgi:hypothetical protein